jgi:hypothetical protein
MITFQVIGYQGFDPRPLLKNKNNSRVPVRPPGRTLYETPGTHKERKDTKRRILEFASHVSLLQEPGPQRAEDQRNAIFICNNDR